MTAGLALFLALDLVLVALALRRAPTPAPAGTSPPAGSPSSSQDGSKHPSSAAFVAVDRDGTILRTARGRCRQRTSPAVDISNDRGKSFEPTTVPGLSEVVAIDRASRGGFEIIGLGKRCRIGRFTDDGSTWHRRSGDAGTWHLTRTGPNREVVSPQGRSAIPCVPRDLSAIDQSYARVLCRDGRIAGTDDGGGSWVFLGHLAGAVAMDFNGISDGVAVTTGKRCPAAVELTKDAGATWRQVACLAGSGPCAVSSMGDLIVAQVGRRTYVSTDAGATFRS